MKSIKLVSKMLAVLVVLTVSFAPSFASGQFFSMENPLTGKPAIDFTLDTLAGKKQSLSQFRDGKKAMIFFWATWCPHCREQLRVLSEQKQAIEKKGIKVLLVDLGETKEEVAAHVQRNKIDFDVFLDLDSSVAEKYAIIGVPTFIFVNEKGVVKAVKHALPNDLDQIFGK